MAEDKSIKNDQRVNVINVIPNCSKSAFTSPISFEIFFEVLHNLPKTLTWKIVYIGLAADSNCVQILEEAELEDIELGQMKFVFEVREYILYYTLGPST